MRALVTLALTLLLAACGLTSRACGVTPRRMPSLTLPSGKQVHLMAVAQMTFPNGETALVLRYQTDLPIDDLPALRKEADEIWPWFQGDVERAKMKNGIVSAQERGLGSFFHIARNQNFVFERDAQGRWMRCQGDC